MRPKKTNKIKRWFKRMTRKLFGGSKCRNQIGGSKCGKKK
jgi:hypothetical protein